MKFQTGAYWDYKTSPAKSYTKNKFGEVTATRADGTTDVISDINYSKAYDIQQNGLPMDFSWIGSIFKFIAGIAIAGVLIALAVTFPAVTAVFILFLILCNMRR
jgi:hypothetical protein